MAKGDSIDGLDKQFIGRSSATAPRIMAGGHPCQGIYWTQAGKQPKVAVIATHYNVDFTEHYIAPYFARLIESGALLMKSVSTLSRKRMMSSMKVG